MFNETQVTVDRNETTDTIMCFDFKIVYLSSVIERALRVRWVVGFLVLACTPRLV